MEASLELQRQGRVRRTELEGQQHSGASVHSEVEVRQHAGWVQSQVNVSPRVKQGSFVVQNSRWPDVTSCKRK